MSIAVAPPPTPIVPRAIQRDWRRAIKRGIAFLDDYFGREDWVHEIDLVSLDLASMTSCVCGQLFDEDAEADREANGYEWAVQNIMENGVPGDDEDRPQAYLGFYLPGESHNIEDRIVARTKREYGVRPFVNVWQLFTEAWIAELKKVREARA